MRRYRVQEKLNRASRILSSSTRPLNRIVKGADVPLIVVAPTTDAPSLDMLTAASSRGSSCYNSYPLYAYRPFVSSRLMPRAFASYPTTFMSRRLYFTTTRCV
jgi:hypothetical protein